jgi:predicted RNA-binding Zn ribbon-like protein
MNVEALTECVEGKEAPMPLLAVQAFANTLDVESDWDFLQSAESFEGWLQKMELAAPGVRVSSKDLEDARALRETIRPLLAANESGETDRKAGNRLAELTSEYRIALTSDPSGELGVDLSRAPSVDELICQLLAIVFQSQATEEWPRLKLCENPECAWAFYDSSRNRSGSWCRMGQCGNRLKNRAYRERKKKAK